MVWILYSPFKIWYVSHLKCMREKPSHPFFIRRFFEKVVFFNSGCGLLIPKWPNPLINPLVHFRLHQSNGDKAIMKSYFTLQSPTIFPKIFPNFLKLESRRKINGIFKRDLAPLCRTSLQLVHNQLTFPCNMSYRKFLAYTLIRADPLIKFLKKLMHLPLHAIAIKKYHTHEVRKWVIFPSSHHKVNHQSIHYSLKNILFEKQMHILF